MHLEEGHLRELRHDFRSVYHVAYDDVPAGEAIDLIETLPDGSAYLAARNPFRAWSQELRYLADIKDFIRACLMRLSGDRGDIAFPLSTRPEDEVVAKFERERARKACEKVSSTRWEAI